MTSTSILNRIVLHAVESPEQYTRMSFWSRAIRPSTVVVVGRLESSTSSLAGVHYLCWTVLAILTIVVVRSRMKLDLTPRFYGFVNFVESSSRCPNRDFSDDGSMVVKLANGFRENREFHKFVEL